LGSSLFLRTNQERESLGILIQVIRTIEYSSSVQTNLASPGASGAAAGAVAIAGTAPGIGGGGSHGVPFADGGKGIGIAGGAIK
jgi:hypothetical protein